MFRLFKKKEKIKRELPPGTIRKEFHFEGNVQNIGFRFELFFIGAINLDGVR